MDMFRSPDFDPEITQHLDLYLEIGPRRFSYVVVDAGTGNIQVLNSQAIQNSNLYPADSETTVNALLKDDLLNKPFKHRHLVWNEIPATLLPKGLLLPENEKALPAWLSANHQAVEVLRYSHNEIDVYFMPAEKDLQRLRRWIPDLKHRHISEALLHLSASITEGDHIWVDIRENSMWVVLRQNQSCLLVNRYTYTTAEDFIYFLLLACEQWKFDRSTCTLHLLGFFTADSQLGKETDKFFAHINFEHTQQLPPDMFDMMPMPAHTFTTLLTLPACG